jgi:hypothetical protein
MNDIEKANNIRIKELTQHIRNYEHERFALIRSDRTNVNGFKRQDITRAIGNKTRVITKLRKELRKLKGL